MKKNKEIKFFIWGGVIVYVIICCKKIWNEYKKVLESRIKFRSYFRILDKWLKAVEQQSILETYFLENHFYTIAIYGMGIMGRHVFEELKDSKEIEILYTIDRNADQIDFSTNVLKIDDDLPDVDVVIVTTVCEYKEIKEMLSKRLSCPIISLEEIIDDWG